MADMLRQFLAHAEAAYPEEACGLVVQVGRKTQVVRCRNSSSSPQTTFTIHPDDYATAEELGEVLAVYHSHPNGSPDPSMADLAMCNAQKLPWHIVSWPVVGHSCTAPTGYVVPLIGRPFVYGIHDCFSLVRDYYQEIGIVVPEFDHGTAGWWNEGHNLYMDGLEAAGFVVVTGPPRLHDVLLMKFNGKVPHHSAVYIGDNQILHHMDDRLSGRAFFGQFYRTATMYTVRHKSLC